MSSSYPEKLKDKKLFLAGGVVAAFECKNTLRANHLEKVVETCKFVKGLCPLRHGTPYKELQAPIIYGLLAHSHSWKGQNSKPLENIQTTVFGHEVLDVQAPYELLDLICVADLATWIRTKMIFLGSNAASFSGASYSDVKTALVCHSGEPVGGTPEKQFTPIGCMIGGLFQKLAYEDSTAISMAHYYKSVDMTGSGSGDMRAWSASVFSEATRARILGGGLKFGNAGFDEWSSLLF